MKYVRAVPEVVLNLTMHMHVATGLRCRLRFLQHALIKVYTHANHFTL